MRHCRPAERMDQAVHVRAYGAGEPGRLAGLHKERATGYGDASPVRLTASDWATSTPWQLGVAVCPKRDMGAVARAHRQDEDAPERVADTASQPGQHRDV